MFQLKLDLPYNVPSHQAGSRKSRRGGWKTKHLESIQELIEYEAINAMRGLKKIEGYFSTKLKIGLKGKKHGDADNMEKTIMDALEGIVFKNDKYGIQMNRSYYYNEKPCIYISITPLEKQNKV